MKLAPTAIELQSGFPNIVRMAAEQTSFITPYNFPGGKIELAVVHIDGMVCHAYRLYRAHGSDQWFAPIKTAAAEAATKLAYGRDTFRGKQKTAAEVWETMLPFLEPIPQLLS